jgi:hypothetical protein
MTTGVLCPVPILQFFDNAGNIAVGGSVLTQIGGVNAATYSDINLTVPLPNPIPLNSRGEASTAAGATAQVFLTPNTVYTFTISDAAGHILDTPQYVNGIQVVITQAEVVTALEIPFSGGPADAANIFLERNALYTGGTPGAVNACFEVETTVGAGAAALEWALLSIMNNSATGGQNVAIYGQGNRETSGTGPTWGGVMEVREVVAINDPTAGLIGLEVDNRSNGTDAHFNRVGIDVVGAQYNTAGVPTTIAWGVRVQANNSTNVTFVNGFAVWDANVEVAFDCGNALSVTEAALRMPSGVPILYDSSGTNQQLFDTVGLAYHVSGVVQSRANANGTLSFGGSTLPVTLSASTAVTASSGTVTLPATAAGYWVVTLSGSTAKIPYYAN